MSNNITDLFAGIKGLKADYKTNSVQNTITNWKSDWSTVSVTLPGGHVAISNSVAPAITGTLSVGNTLTCSQGTWAGVPTPSFTYEWHSSYGGVLQTTSSAPSIATLGTVTGGSGYTTAGTYNGVALTGGNGTGATANIVVSGGAVTTVTLVNHGTGYAVGDTLSASNTNLGGAGSGFSVPVATITTTTSTYVVKASDVGSAIYCKVSATNSDSTVIVKTATVGVASTASTPSNTVAPSISGSLLIASKLTANVGTWTGYPLPKYTYAWSSTHAPIATLGSITGGTSYVNGSYNNVPLTGGNGTGAIANITVAGGAVTAVVITNAGNGYQVGDALSASNTNLGGAGSGFSVPVATLAVVGTDSTYITQAVDIGANITVKVTATNASGSGNATSSAAGPILSSFTAPSNTAVPTITGTVAVGQTLTASTGTWTGTPTPTYSYQWYSGSHPIGSGSTTQDVGGSGTGSTYVVQSSDVGNKLSVVVTAANSGGNATATSAQTTTVAAVVPANTVLPVITGSPTVDQTLSCNLGTWTGSPSPTYTFQWYSGATAVASYDVPSVNVVGGQQLKSSYVVQGTDVGNSITCKVTATNTGGSTSATSTGVTAVAASSLPKLATAGAITNPSPTTVGQVTVGDVLHVTVATFTGGSPSPTITQQWFANNGMIPGATGTTYTVASEYAGMVITVETIATNAAGVVTNMSAGVGPVLL